MTQIAKLDLLRKLTFAFAIAWIPSFVWADDDASTDEAQHSALFDQLDANADAALTGDEIPEDQQQLFARLLRNGDTDDDGELSREEFALGLKNDRGRNRRGANDDSPRRGPRPGDRPSPERIFDHGTGCRTHGSADAFYYIW